ncbi:MAG TPA: hypothetical protein VEB59_07975, partial [Gemmatimonadales bacterium]|nr:hypothetical protein [Gemmatimonadales bacterium]
MLKTRWLPRPLVAPFGALALILAACQQDSVPTAEPTAAAPALVVDPETITLTYVCANRYSVRNTGPIEATVTYVVVGTSESGQLTLPAPVSPATHTDTPLTTQSTGTVQLLLEGTVIEEVPNGARSCPPDPVSAGLWGPLFDWPIVAIHLNLLPTGKIFSFTRQRDGQPQLWDPATGVFTPKPVASDVFCSGHAFLPDGRLLVVGGRYTADNLGIADVNIFNPWTEAWEAGPPMKHARWYPTATVMGNGEVVVTAGTDQLGVHVTEPEVFSGSGWRALTGAQMKLPFYPKQYLAPGNLIYYSGDLPRSRFLNPTGTGSWKLSVRTNYNLERSYGGGVMYEYGKILLVGGNKAAPT